MIALIAAFAAVAAGCWWRFVHAASPREREDQVAEAIRGLRSRQADRREQSLALLERASHPDAVPALKSAMTTARRPWVRLEAAGALARMGQLPLPPATVAVLGLGLRPPSSTEQAILDALAVQHMPETVRLSHDPDYRELRAALVSALSHTGQPALLATLAEHARDPDPSVRLAALVGGRALDHPTALHFAAPMTRDLDEEVRAAAAALCAALTPRKAGA